MATTGGPYPVLQCPAPPPESMAFRVGVLVSGEGTNLQALLDTVHGRDGIEVVVRRLEPRRGPRARAGARRRASRPACSPRPTTPTATRATPRSATGSTTTASTWSCWPASWRSSAARSSAASQGRIVNVHPSLLPAFPGVRAIEQALDYGVQVMGVTVHFVDEGVDSGPVILQEAFELPYARDIEAIEARVHEIEHRLLPRAVRLIAAGAVSRRPATTRGCVRIDGETAEPARRASPSPARSGSAARC